MVSFQNFIASIKTKTGILILLLCMSILGNIIFASLVLSQQLPNLISRLSGDSISLLSSPIQLSGTKAFAEKGIAVDPQMIHTFDAVRIEYNLHGLCALPGEASGVFFQDIRGEKFPVSLAKYGKNCFNGNQTVTIPFSDFGKLLSDIIELHIAFWYPTRFMVDVNNISVTKRAVLGAKTKQHRKISPAPKPTILPSVTAIVTLTATASPSPRPVGSLNQSWQIQSVSSMKETKDKVCGQDTDAFIQQWVDTAKNLGVNYIAVETPYDNPSCGSAVAYTNTWLDVIRSRGLNVWHRHMPLTFEGIYTTAKDPARNYIQQISEYIKANASFFRPGDIFTPIPEPQNGGINGVTYCSSNICMFNSAAQFNQWLRDAMTASHQAFQSIGLGGKIKVGYFGFDGFVAWGDNNPDWHGILEDATIKQMGNITIDHYPEAVGDTMQNDLHELQTKYPKVPIVMGEWGTITGGDVQQQILQTMTAAKHPGVIGFNYWHMGMGGPEALINDDFSQRPSYAAVQSFFIPKK